MAVGQNLLFGRMRQKIGGIVTSTWKGINVIKSKPLSVANPKTDKQVMRRAALIDAMKIARQLVAVISQGFKEQAVFKSSFNAFVGYILRNAYDYSDPPAIEFLPDLMLVSQGSISPTPITSIVSDVSVGTTVITWSPGVLAPGQSNNDTVMVVLRNSVTKKYFAGVNLEVRSTGDVTIAIADFEFVAGETVEAYLGFYNVASRKSSDSQNDTTVAIA